MGQQQGRIAVTAGDLRAVGGKIETSADAAARAVHEFDGQQGVRSGEAGDFDTMAAARRCEQSWQHAVQVAGAKLAVAADKLDLNADAYAATEQVNARESAGAGVISYRDLRDCDTSVFDKDAAKWQELSANLADRGNEIQSATTGLATWTGAAAEAAKDEFATHRKNYADMAATIGRIPAVLTGLAGQLRTLQPKIGAIVSEAAANGCTVADDGSVRVDPGHDPAGTPAAAQAYQDGIADLLTQARDADARAVAALDGLTAQAAGFAPAGEDATLAAASTAIPGRTTAPSDVRKWWSGLSPTQQESLLFMHPDQLGQLDGLPSPIRDRANRAKLAEQKGSLQADKERLDQLGDGRTSAQSAQLDSIDKSLTGVDAIEQRLYHAPTGTQPAYLLGFDSAGNGRAIVAMGDPDAAANVATYVPGTGASLGHVKGDLQRSDSMVQSARNAGSPSTSVITWVGYDAPQNIVPQAAEDKYADGAVRDLDRFQDGLRASHQGTPAHNTVIGHSYGTTVVGHAARDGDLNANDVVFVASPGVGVTHADQLHLDGVPQDQVGQHVHSTVAQHDPIQLAAGINGPAPTGGDFGGTTFSSDPGKAGPWYELGWNVAVHSQYWDDGNKALVNMGRVIAGQPTY